jgi:hypothetical protein
MFCISAVSSGFLPSSAIPLPRRIPYQTSLTTVCRIVAVDGAPAASWARLIEVSLRATHPGRA